jgi:hypothetical protein
VKAPRLLLLPGIAALVIAALLTYSAVRAGWTWQGWTAVASIATFLAVVVALALGIWGDELRTLGRSPRLSLTLDPLQDHFQRLTHDAGSSEYDYRISVTNEGGIGAKNVEVVAQDLTVKQADGSFTRDPVFMAMNLRRTHYGDTITPIVHRGVPRAYDLLRCLDPALQQERNREQGKARVTLRFDLSTLVSPVRAQPVVPGRKVALPDAYPSSKTEGTYRLHLAVVADGVAPVKKVVEISWSGKWWDHAADFFKNELNVRLL